MVKTADIVVENFRNGVAKEMKIDYETLKEINPKIIYAAGSGFGQYGPLSKRPCYDIVAQSMGGIVNLTGFPDHPPTKVGPSVADNVTGIYLCVGILMALHYREKTGIGQMVDVAMLDTVFSLLENAIVITTMTGEVPQRQGNIDPSIAPFDIYKSRDGHIAIGVGNDKLFKKFCSVIGRPDLGEEPLYHTNELRCKNYTSGLQAIIAEWAKDKDSCYIEELFDKAGIPCGPVLDMQEAIEHPQIKARNMMVDVEHPTIGPMSFQGCPIKFSETPGSIETPAPVLGQHNAEILGVTDQELQKMKNDNVL
jgi:CoA:oxalate CoA-transferase